MVQNTITTPPKTLEGWKWWTQLRENNAQLEVANETNQATIAQMTEDHCKIERKLRQIKRTKLNADLRKSEAYGDELRDTLNKHNLTHLANKKPWTD